MNSFNDMLDPTQFKKLFESLDKELEAEGSCPHCGKLKDSCTRYPQCVGNPEWKPEGL